MPSTKAQHWEAIARTSSVSHSFASTLQRELAELHERMEARGLTMPEQPAMVEITPLIEAETGRLANYSA